MNQNFAFKKVGDILSNNVVCADTAMLRYDIEIQAASGNHRETLL